MALQEWQKKYYRMLRLGERATRVPKPRQAAPEDPPWMVSHEGDAPALRFVDRTPRTVGFMVDLDISIVNRGVTNLSNLQLGGHHLVHFH